MLAPIDKINARGNDIMQIVVTTACDRNCSNCTQLLPFRTDYKFMSVACFRAAVHSLEGWPGVVALFGGNPCVHPKFPELCQIMTELVPAERRGLWTNNVFKHGELAAKTFGQGRLNLNAHGDPEAFAEMSRYFPGRVIAESRDRASMHSAILANWIDLGMSEAAWIEARERCDINQKWSAAIVERNGAPYGYFCEVAASIDGIRGVNNGIPALEGWWRRRMDSFGEQVRNCCDRGCGVPLRLKGHLDNREIYDVSPSWREFVTTKTVTIEIHQSEPEHCEQSTDYMRRVSSV
jgi:hypothetical protein